jgi:hypothetical protein
MTGRLSDPEKKAEAVHTKRKHHAKTVCTGRKGNSTLVKFQLRPDPAGALRGALETNCLPGHIGLEPANPHASYLIGFT